MKKLLCFSSLFLSLLFFSVNASAWEYYRFPWANAERSAPFDNTDGYDVGGPLLGAAKVDATTINPVYDGNPIWNTDAVFFDMNQTRPPSWYDCLDADMHWNLAITNHNDTNCTAYLRVYVAGALADESTPVEGHPNNSPLINTATASPIVWDTTLDRFTLTIPANETLVVSSREIFNQAIFGPNPTEFAQIHASLSLVTQMELETLLRGEISSHVRVMNNEDGRHSSLDRNQWSTIQYAGISSLDRVIGEEEHVFLPYFRTERTGGKVDFATGVLLMNPHPTTRDYTMAICKEDGSTYCPNQTLTLAPHEIFFFLPSQYLPSGTTAATGTIDIVGEQPAALAVGFSFSHMDPGVTQGNIIFSSTHAIPFQYLGAAPSATN